ncbi:hypothetical protein [Caulobacter sp. Root343]|uniref:hypothetical protein n=1 Tax=Caulobacter sp. Root343 TaxID=1736520 RepID=UPI000AEC99A8|nr:hypothetical protein [Caulobacter sp. Root343]
MKSGEKSAVGVLAGLACVVLAVLGLTVLGLTGALYGKPGPAYATPIGYQGEAGPT